LIQDRCDDRDQGRLAAARGADKHEQLTASDVKVDPAQRHHDSIACTVGLGQASAAHRNVVAHIKAAFQVWGNSISSCHDLPFGFPRFKKKM
jgi:hypothetical protein